jgi:hypothetical protein
MRIEESLLSTPPNVCIFVDDTPDCPQKSFRGFDETLSGVQFYFSRFSSCV